MSPFVLLSFELVSDVISFIPGSKRSVGWAVPRILRVHAPDQPECVFIKAEPNMEPVFLDAILRPVPTGTLSPESPAERKSVIKVSALSTKPKKAHAAG